MSSVPTRRRVASAQPSRPRLDIGHRTRRVSPIARTIAKIVRGTATSADGTRLFGAIVCALLGLCVATGAAMADVYLHRGVETSAALPYVFQVSGRDLATNIDLLSFSPDQIDATASILSTNGFRVVRQPFSWSSIEPEPGQFVWEPYDRIVAALNSHGIQIVAVLARSPEWARAPAGIGAVDAPPADIATYVAFVQQVVARYSDRVQYVQLWDLPNRADHWGGTAATPVQYADLLANGFNASRAGDAETKVVLAELDPSGDGMFGADLRFLRAIYDLGRAAFFDVVAARIDGGTVSPYDRAVHPGQKNLSRAILFRELMVAKGDVEKPIWLTRYGWQTGAVSEQDQAAFLVGGIERARSEWPWLGLMFAWDLVPNGTTDDSAAYALLHPRTDAGEASDMFATPAFEALSAFGMSDDAALAGTGYIPMDSRPVEYGRTWEDQHLDERVFKTTGETTASATLRFRGTGVVAYLRQSTQAGKLRATLDGGPLPGWGGDSTGSLIDLKRFQAQSVWFTLASGLDDGPHELVLTLETPKELTIGGIVVSRQPPLVWPVALLALAAFVLVARALREASYLAATRAGYLQARRGGVELRPPLPHLPDWRPSRRT